MAEPKKTAKKEAKKEVKEVVETVETVETTDSKTAEKETTAKAGKRSAKAQKEQAEKEAKEERKAKAVKGEEESAKAKPAVKPRSRLERRGKNYRKSQELIEKDKTYALEEALKLAKNTSKVKFDATVELHVNLGVDPRHADQNVRDTLVLPKGTGKKVTVAVLTVESAEAKKAGADIAGSDELFAQLEKGQLNFDVLIATPGLMPKLGKYARLLGPRGLMPNPKSGTVTSDVNKAVAEAKAGRVEYRVDSTGIVHLGIGKVSFGETDLLDNAQAVLSNIKGNKPASVKGSYIKAVHITTSMGPSVKVELSSVA